MRVWRLIVASCIGLVATSVHAAPRSIRFKVINRSRHVIEAANIVPSATAQWGANLLAKGALKPNMSAVLEFTGECGTYDLRFVAEKGVHYFVESESFCAHDDVVTIGAHDVKKSAPNN